MKMQEHDPQRVAKNHASEDEIQEHIARCLVHAQTNGSSSEILVWIQEKLPEILRKYGFRIEE